MKPTSMYRYRPKHGIHITHLSVTSGRLWKTVSKLNFRPHNSCLQMMMLILNYLYDAFEILKKLLIFQGVDIDYNFFLCVKVMMGYYKNPAATEKTIVDDWLM